ncbi:hypothetical protein AYI69_g2504 [Smittium culicis]|uniref:Uncharacterized protein n=1 Tax=Smittium culicis TaxID=133412 RepID=A0A1R1YMD2_9FUNG|nr:hypothetical protein AYI69_g2504 [Smittium culicis]
MKLNNFLPSRTPSPPWSRYEEDYDNQTHPLTSTSMRSDGEYEHGMDRGSSLHNGSFPKIPIDTTQNRKCIYMKFPGNKTCPRIYFQFIMTQ